VRGDVRKPTNFLQQVAGKGGRGDTGGYMREPLEFEYKGKSFYLRTTGRER